MFSFQDSPGGERGKYVDLIWPSERGADPDHEPDVLAADELPQPTPEPERVVIRRGKRCEGRQKKPRPKK